jgi:hypothetical protein
MAGTRRANKYFRNSNRGERLGNDFNPTLPEILSAEIQLFLLGLALGEPILQDGGVHGCARRLQYSDCEE